MKKVCVVTATRAEYGLLRNLIKNIDADKELDLYLAATGTHLSEEYGNTIQEILDDGYLDVECVDILDADNSKKGTLKTIANAVEKFGEYFEKVQPDMIVVLGDRYELLGICEAAMILNIPIAHISGGEITQGVMDDVIRHCITKMSHIHFPGCEAYRRRIIQLGEQPDSVFNYGDVGVENILSMDYMSKEELGRTMDFNLEKPYACVTFHPVTLSNISAEEQIQELLNAIVPFDNMQFIITGANADPGGKIINQTIREFADKHENCRFYDSLGSRRYLSLLRYSEMVLGNSSSGIVEAPCFKIPTVNIGDRQKGRLQAQSIINCRLQSDDIIQAIRMALAPEFRKKAATAQNPYDGGDTSNRIVEEIKKYLNSDMEKTRGKRFYDI